MEPRQERQAEHSPSAVAVAEAVVAEAVVVAAMAAAVTAASAAEAEVMARCVG